MTRVGRWKEPILGYVLKNDEKKEFRMEGVNVLYDGRNYFQNVICGTYVFIYIIIKHMYLYNSVATTIIIIQSYISFNTLSIFI